MTSLGLWMFSGISIICFAASYAVALCLEFSRLFFRVSLRTAVMVGFVVAGLVAHSLYLSREAHQGLAAGAPLSSWYHGCLLIAWLLVSMSGCTQLIGRTRLAGFSDPVAEVSSDKTSQ